jgi:diguanylate cyclase (GGDEF)-like protein
MVSIMRRSRLRDGRDSPVEHRVHSRLTALADFLRPLFERSPDPYAGADLATSRRFQAGLLGLCGLLALAFLPFEHPDEQIGAAGWPIAAGLGLCAIAGAVAMARRQPSFDDLLVVAYAGLAGIAVLNYLAGGGSSAYEDLYVLWLGAGAAHPPRRALTHLGATVAALALPVFYEGTSGAVLSDMAAEALILIAIGVLLTAYQMGVRRQRLGLEAGAEVARRLASVDGVTGLGNRRSFDETLTVEVARAAREHVALSLGLVDVDNLRRVNDRYGHLEGDRFLAEVARAMERSVRATDRCFRWAGDEFVVVMPATDRATAEQALERMAEGVREVVETRDGRTAELTWGAAALDAGGGAEDLLAAADVALLERKAEKNR